MLNHSQKRNPIAQTTVDARVVEYDIEAKTFTLSIEKDRTAVLYNDGLFDKLNTAACYVGRTIPVVISEERTQDGALVCHMIPEFYKAKRFAVGSKLQGTVVAHLGYGVIVETAPGKTGLLHLNRIKERYPEINNPSEVDALSIGRVIECYLESDTDSGVKLTFSSSTDCAQKRNVFRFLKTKLAS